MEGRKCPSRRTQGDYHGQYSRSTPQAVVPEGTPQGGRGLSPPTGPTAAPEPTPNETALAGTTPPSGPQGRPEPPPAQAALRPTPRAGPHRLRAPGPGPDPTHLSAPRLAGPGRHPHRGRSHHRPLAPLPRRLGPGPLQQLSPRPLAPPLARPSAGASVHRRRPGSVRPPRHRSSWSATIPSPNTPDPRSTAKGVIATPSVPPTRSPPSAGDTSGSSWRCWSAPRRSGAGPCR